MGRHLLGKLEGEAHLGGTGLYKGISVGIGHSACDNGEGAQVGAYDFQSITLTEFVV